MLPISDIMGLWDIIKIISRNLSPDSIGWQETLRFENRRFLAIVLLECMAKKTKHTERNTRKQGTGNQPLMSSF